MRRLPGRAVVQQQDAGAAEVRRRIRLHPVPHAGKPPPNTDCHRALNEEVGQGLQLEGLRCQLAWQHPPRLMLLLLCSLLLPLLLWCPLLRLLLLLLCPRRWLLLLLL